jgi:formate-dependent nitrite reductase membrane component NrfD
MSEVRSYHGQPVIKKPIWTWEIPCYFFTGGLAGASAGLAYLSELRGEEELARRAWAAALAGVGVSPLLLISDLGRPARFINMLRMFKVTSPMSVGSWILSASGATTTVAAAHAWFGLFPRSSRVARPLAAILGLPLSTYTAALAANTAVPVWHEARRTLPFVFAAGAGLSAGAAATALTAPEQAASARRLALAGSIAELAAQHLMQRRLGEHAEAYESPVPKRSEHVAQAGLVAGTALMAARGRSSRAAAAAAGGLMLAGALATRWSIFKAGFASAADPRYVVGPQRAGISAGDRAGAARSQPLPASTATAG